MYFFIFLLFLLTSCQQISDLGVLVPPTVDQDPSLPKISVKVAGQQRLLHYKVYGNASNPPLFFLHGSYTDINPYNNICKALSDRYYVIIWDQRGCGLSQRITEEEFTLESAVDEILEIKKIFSPNSKISIIGQSWGGGLAALFTSRHYDKVSQLILIEPMPLIDTLMQKLYKSIVEFSYDNSGWNNLARHGHALCPYDHEQIDYRALMILKSTMTGNYHCDKNNPPDWPVHRVGGFIEYVRNKRLGDFNGTEYKFKYNFVDGIKNFTDTVLILGGSCSSLGYEMQVKNSKPFFNLCKVVEIKNAGHRMNMEKFDEVIKAIKNYLKEYQK